MARVIFHYGHQCACTSGTTCDSTEPTLDEVRNACSDLILDDSQLLDVMLNLEGTIENALAPKEGYLSPLKSYKWDFCDLPNGTERGKYLALDLPGRIFNIVLIDIKVNKQVDVTEKEFTIPKELMVGPGKLMFDFVAECLARFVKTQDLQTLDLSMGFTFVPYTTQKSINSAVLDRFSGDFVCSKCLGKDMVQMLQDAIDKRGDLKIRVEVFLNETLGALISCGFRYSNCKIGVYIGGTCNACYCENKINLESFDEFNNYKVEKTFVDTQWATFGDEGSLHSIRTPYDVTLDKNSLYPGKTLFEKMISLNYLGELVRIIICELIDKNLLFTKDNTEVLKIKGRFPTKYISEIECDPFGCHNRCKEILTDYFSLRNPTDDDCTNVRYICECVSRRSADLLSAGISVLVNKLNEDNISIGIDGCLYMYHPYYHHYIVEKLNKLVNDYIRFSVLYAKYGRGRGAALAAAVVKRVRNNRNT